MKEVTVFNTWDEPMADMAVGLLRAEGIAAYKRDSGLRSSIAITTDGLGEIKVRVPVTEAERAREILAVRFSEGDVSESDGKSGDE